MARTDRHLRRIILLVGAALTVIVLSLYSLDWLEGVELGLYDLRARECQIFAPKPSDKIVHVDLDDATLEAVGAWPWPRSAMAEIIDEMSAAGAKSIALDVLYTQPQKPEWVPDEPVAGDRASAMCHLVNHDANLAAAFRRAKNVLLPASLRFVYTHRPTAGTSAAIALLSANLELTRPELSAALKSKGFGDTEIADVDGIFFDLRREATRTAVDKALAEMAPLTTLPAPATSPASIKSASDSAMKESLLRRLFPHVDPRQVGPESRLVDEVYEQARSARALYRLGRAKDPNAVAFESRSETLPVRSLLEAAGASAFVDYPNIADGTIRSVPLFLEHDGRWVPQFGLSVACQVLEIDPAELKITPTQIIIPSGKFADGSDRPQRIIPVRTMKRIGVGGRTTDYPLIMDIPWFGGRQWWSMYDPSRPSAKAQHVSMSRVADVVRFNRSVAGNSRKIDDGIRFILGVSDRPGGYKTLGLEKDSALAYLKNQPAPEDWPRREKTAKRALELLKQSGLLESFEQLKREEMTAKERGQYDELRTHVANISAGLVETPALVRQINEQRLELKRLLGGKGAFIGWTAIWTAADRKATPLHSDAPGVVGHAVVANAILTGDFWRMAPGWVTGLVVVCFGLLVTFAVAGLSPARSVVATLFLLIGYTLLNAYVLFDYGNILVDLAAPLLAIVVPWTGGTTARLMIEAREKARITKRFATYVDPDLVNYVLQSRNLDVFKGQQRPTAVVFTDLEGFTKLSEQLKEDVVPLLNDFMGRATRVIKKHGGLLDKFLGDGILFFFNAPIPNARYVPAAIDAILDLQKMMVQFNADLQAKGLQPVRLRAGMTTGEVTAGDAGSEERANYTVLGDLVNLASRLESANKFFGTSSLVTEAAVQMAGEGYLFRPIGVIQVVGRQTGETVYEVMAWKDEATPQQVQVADASMAVFEAIARGDAAECLSAVKKLESASGVTKLTKMYRSHCEPYVSGAVSGPMPSAIVLGEK